MTIAVQTELFLLTQNFFTEFERKRNFVFE